MSHGRLFLASCLSLATCGVLFGIRSSCVDALVAHFQSNHAVVGDVLSMGFYGMGMIILVSSPLCDFLGMRRLLWLAFLMHVAGIVGFLFAPGSATDATLFWAKAAMFCVGLAHGLVEGVINPLIATVYSDNKTGKLNILHAWWPGGIVIGGLFAYFAAQQGLSWQLQWSAGLVPAVLYGVAMAGVEFPKTERVASGVSASAMVTATLHPLFLVFVALMAVTGATELGTGQWLDSVLKQTAKFSGILLLVYGSVLMFVMRFFAGPIAHKISSIGLLTVSAAIATVGLYLLSITDSPALGFAAATVFYVGVCYFWPTMLAVVSERFPRTGALGMGLMGAAGINGSAYFIGWMGGVYEREGAERAFGTVTLLPLGCFAVFALIWLWMRARGGHGANGVGAAR
jgi:MFS family permease